MCAQIAHRRGAGRLCGFCPKYICLIPLSACADAFACARLCVSLSLVTHIQPRQKRAATRPPGSSKQRWRRRWQRAPTHVRSTAASAEQQSSSVELESSIRHVCVSPRKGVSPKFQKQCGVCWRTPPGTVKGVRQGKKISISRERVAGESFRGLGREEGSIYDEWLVGSSQKGGRVCACV